MTAINASDTDKNILLNDYSLGGEGFGSLINLLNNDVLKLDGTSSVILPSKSARVFLLETFE